MIAAQRQREILNEVVKEGSVRVAELATRLDVTEETIRRDLDKLEETGKIRRSHGGAVLADQGPQESPHWAREQVNRAEKNAIAQAAAARVEPGDTIILDASSTAYYLAAHLPDIPVTVITNSSKVAIALADQDQVKVICIGGTLSPKSLSFVGPVAERNLGEFSADKAFLSCGAVDDKLGLSDANELQAELRRLMIERSDHHTLMCDFSKFGSRTLAHIADMDAFQEVITDNAIDESFRKKLSECVDRLTIVDVSPASQSSVQQKGQPMAENKVYLAVDLGAGSGRVVAGVYDGSVLKLDEIHRFPSGCQNVLGHDYWNILQIFGDIKEGIRMAVQKYGDAVQSVAVDTWGVDYAYVDESGALLGLPLQYRDPRTKGMDEEMYARVPKKDIYEATGIQFIFLNTANQIMSEVVNGSVQMATAQNLLFIPDLINFWLTGVRGNERTIASTSQLWNPRTGDWDKELIKRLGMRPEVFGKIIEPCTHIGDLLEPLQEELGANIAVVAAASHDTGSAIAATPLNDKRSAYVSSGTWSLMGIETPEPIINETTLALNFTNEAGIDGTIRLLKNISGLWLFEECRRAWAEEGRSYDYGAMVKLAEEAKPFSGYIDPDDEAFIEAGGMPERIQSYCRGHGKPVPETDGEILRTALEGIAFKYLDMRNHIEALTGEKMTSLHIVGGGSQNAFLNQLAADAINRPVVAGPVEATSAGNIICQMIADQELVSIEEGRLMIKLSFDVETYEPTNHAEWEAAATRLR